MELTVKLRKNINIERMYFCWFLCLVTILIINSTAEAEKWLSFNDFDQSNSALVVEVLEQSLNSVLVEMRLNGVSVQEIEENRERFQLLKVLESEWTDKAGKPKLPVIRKLLTIGSDKEVKIQVENERHKIFSGYNVYPVGKKVVKNSYVDEEFVLDQKFYSDNKFYPEELASISFSGKLREQNLVQLQLHPIRFNPVSSEIICYSFLQVRLTYTGSVASKYQQAHMAPPANVNSTGEVIYPEVLTGIHKADYVVIAPEQFYKSDKLREFADWRAQYSGLDVAIVSVEKVDEYFQGSPDVKIRQFIQHAYEHWKSNHMSDQRIGYALLLGDVEFIPTHISGRSFVSEERIATDNWYACVSGEDSAPDIMLGRIPAKNTDEMNLMLDKIIRYEKEPFYGEWANNALLMLGTAIGPDSENIERARDEYLVPAGYNVSEISQMDGGNASDVIYEINEGQHIVYYSGHGWVDHLQIFHETDIPQLQNDRKLPAVFHMSCNTGRFDHPDSDSIGEALLKTPNGAIAFFGASRLSPTLNGSILFGLLESVAERHRYILGEIVMNIKLKILPNVSNIELYNLFGDPALDLFAARRRPGKADLAVSSADISFKPEKPKQGDEVEISVTINNLGTTDVRDATLELKQSAGLETELNRSIIATRVISNIAAGERRKCSFLWRVPLGLAQHSFYVSISPTEDYAEYYIENNDAQKTLVVSLETEGWPLEVEKTRLSAPIAADMDLDGDMELLVQSTVNNSNNSIYIWHHDGQLVSGWPRTLSMQESGVHRHGRRHCPHHGKPKENIKLYLDSQYFNSSAGPTPAVGDLDGDGHPEIVAVFSGNEVFAWNKDGTVLSGWPVNTEGYATTSPVLADLNRDGHLEVVLGLSNGQMQVLRGYDGSPFTGWPKNVGQNGHLFPVVTDIDGDGNTEIVALHSPLPKYSGITTSNIYAWNHDGSDVKGWPVDIEGADAILPPAAGDLDGDGTAEVVAVSVSEGLCKVYIWNYNGRLADGWPIQVEEKINSAVTLGDLDEDGDIEIIACCDQKLVYAWHHDGRRVFGWPVHLDSQRNNSSSVLGDVDGDGKLEIVFTSYRGIVNALRCDGTPVKGWPAITSVDHSSSPPVITDMDGDGRTELAYTSGSGKVFMLSLIGQQTDTCWNMFLCNPMHTGSCDTEIALPKPPTGLIASDIPNDKGDSIALSWNLSPDDGNVSGYVIYRSDNFEGQYLIVGEAERGIANYTDNTTQAGMTYWYVVRSRDEKYLSANFNPVSVRALNNFAPKRPESVSAQKGSIDNTLEIRWTKGSESDLAGYKIYKGVVSGKYDEPVKVNVTDYYLLTGLTNGTKYYISVTAYDTEGNESLHSREVSAIPEDDDIDPPSFSEFYPKEVSEGRPFNIRCKISDKSGVYDESSGQNGQGIYVLWDDDGELSDSSNVLSMSILSQGIYITDEQIPRQTSGKQIVYKLSACDDDCDWGRENDRTRGFSEENTVNIVSAPEKNVLLQNYPNPFNPETWIPYKLSEDSDVCIKIYNLRGELVRILELGFHWRGRYTDRENAAYWDGRNQLGERVSSGIYFYFIQADNFAATRKMIIVD